MQTSDSLTEQDQKTIIRIFDPDKDKNLYSQIQNIYTNAFEKAVEMSFLELTIYQSIESSNLVIATKNNTTLGISAILPFSFIEQGLRMTISNYLEFAKHPNLLEETVKERLLRNMFFLGGGEMELEYYKNEFTAQSIFFLGQ